MSTRKTRIADDARHPETAARLAALREALGLSQEKLAEAGNLHRTDVVTIERGKRAASSARVRGGYAKASGLPLETIDAIIAGEVDPAAELARRQATRATERDARYPNMEEAVRLYGAKWRDDTLADLRRFKAHSPVDPPVGWWLDFGDLIDAAHREGRAIGTPLPYEDDTPPAGRER